MADRSPLRFLLAWSLGAVLVAVPIDALTAGADAVGSEALLDTYMSPFETVVGRQMVVGGVRCDGDDCAERLAEVAVLSADGQIETTLTLRREPTKTSTLDGMTLIGHDDAELWVNAGGSLYHVSVTPLVVMDEVPWAGGEPCVIDGAVHDLQVLTDRADGHGLLRESDASLELQLRTWSDGRWLAVEDGDPTIEHGQNAYCTPGGFEIRDTSATGDRIAGPGEPRAELSGVHHYNVCSAACGDDRRVHSRELITRLVNAHQPAAVSLNEVCYDDIAYLSGHLADYEASAGFIALERATSCPGAMKQFGNALLVHRSLEPQPVLSAQFPTQSSLPCGQPRPECRGMACAEATTRRDESRTRFCTAHLETPRRGAEIAAVQARQYVDISAANNTDGPSVLAGDFNLEPGDVDAIFEREDYRTAVIGSTISTQDPPASRQIDMIYAAGRESPDTRGTTHCDPHASDHCYLISGS